MAFYRRERDTYLPTEHCIGPWHPSAQHGGPPSALLGGACERFGDDPHAFVVTRVTVELLRPVGFKPLSVEVTPTRLGRTVHWLSATLSAEGRLLARANVVRVARTRLDLPERTQPLAAPSGPKGLTSFVFPFFQTEQGYHRAVELRAASGTWGDGPCTMWMRPRHPLVQGRETTPLERLLICADATNGIAPALPVQDWVFINPDLTVHLTRPLQGEWLALEARSLAEEIGTGLVQSRLFDERGELGRCQQSLMIRPR